MEMNSPTLTKTHCSAHNATQLLTTSYLLQDTLKRVCLALSQAVLIAKTLPTVMTAMKVTITTSLMTHVFTVTTRLMSSLKD